MNKLLSIFFIFILITQSGLEIYAQISPGKLSTEHAHLEGLSNCTKCHDLGNKVPDTKCLDCHNEIQSLIDADRGYHASEEVLKNDCVKCHNEHHGLKFDMKRFDEEAFDHLLTGYALKGKHATTDCKDCHNADNIEDPEIKLRTNTFIGLTSNCLSCHTDYHQQTLGNDCASCHDENAFRPAALFDHKDTKFLLSGAHLSVECILCHPVLTLNGQDFQKFSEVEFKSCTSCHNDEHIGNLPGNCIACHNETSFDVFVGQRKFNHNLTDFKLKGKHQSIDCFSCHNQTLDPANIFQDKKNIQEESCISCHEDVHQEKFGNECSKCHSEDSFVGIKDPADFNHTMTDYPLEGKHITVDCKSCHVDDFLSPIEFGQCFECHEDFHEGAFVVENIQKDCKDCHSVYEEFTYTTFTIEEHNATSFALDGAHLATPCFACHLTEDEKWIFTNKGESCIDCHDNVHKNNLSEKYLLDNNCTICHNTNDWKSVEFDHELTPWSLEGAHVSLNCIECHINEAENKIGFTVQSSGAPHECNQCHSDVHNNQFTLKGKSRCSECHNPESWKPAGFNHNNSSFRLDGIHAETECIKCHKIVENEAGLQYSEYKIAKHECVDCHL